MTLAEYSTFITNKVGQTDSTSVALCKEFVKMRHRMIWDSHTWRDSLGLVPALVADTSGVMSLPDGIERIMAIRSTGNHILYPADSPYVMQVDPQAFEAMGDPLAYEEFTDIANSNARMIRFFPIPSQNTAMLVFGKRALVQLNADTDMPVLRNIDNALIAYATGDMLERQRQYGKAQAKFQEASAHLDLMRRIETEQAGRVQRVVPEQLEPGWDGEYEFFLDKGNFLAGPSISTEFDLVTETGEDIVTEIGEVILVS